MKSDNSNDWRQILESGFGEREKREDLLAATLWALGVGNERRRLRNSRSSDRGLLTKLLTEWILWKWPTHRGLPGLHPTEATPIFDLWTERAIEARDNPNLPKDDKSIRHEHSIPRSVLAQELIRLDPATKEAKESVEHLLRSFSIEVTMLKSAEADKLDRLFKDKLPPGAKLTSTSSPDFVWCRYAAWISAAAAENQSDFAIWLIPWWKQGKKWNHGWSKDSSKRDKRCIKVYPITG